MTVCSVLLLSLCVVNGLAQTGVRYPQNADDIIAFVGAFSQANFSVEDAIKQLGTINPADLSSTNWYILLTPFPSSRDEVKRVVLRTFDEKKKLDSVEIVYVKPISVSYGGLLKKYGPPGYIKPPVAKCLPRAVNCPPSFVGYRFSFVPDRESLASGKSLEVSINLEMGWSKVVPQHTDEDFLAVKAIHFKRVWRDR
jgi:hypothetical protein